MFFEISGLSSASNLTLKRIALIILTGSSSKRSDALPIMLIWEAFRSSRPLT